MTTEEFNKSLEAKLQKILKLNIPLAIGVKSVMALQHKRIFIKNLDTSGGKIGTYSDRAVYVNPKNAPNPITTKGKNGETKFKNGNLHKTGYFKTYPDFKSAVGRVKKKNVDLLLFGHLQSNWANAPISSDGNINLKDIKANMININNFYTSLKSENIKKVERYGVQEVFGLSVVEKGKFLAVVQSELAKALK